jgi:hypothetical protein
MSIVWELLNSPAGITLMAAIVLFVLNKVYARKPAWKQFEGAIITGIKLAEQAVPDSTENKSLRRLNEALQYVVRVYEEAYHTLPDDKTLASIKDGIGIKHSELEALGQLHGNHSTTDSADN